jgi:hypothetical protein
MTDSFPSHTSGADFSPCRKYRYKLWRVWDSSKPICLFILLNPSTADEVENDPTVERCERRARQMSFGGLTVCNVFAFRATSPDIMKAQKDPIGLKNDSTIADEAARAGMVICGWGENGQHISRSKAVLAVLHRAEVPLHYLRLNKSGEPQHPLYISYRQQPQLWSE